MRHSFIFILTLVGLFSSISYLADPAHAQLWCGSTNNDNYPNDQRANGAQCNHNDKCKSRICSGGVCVGRPNTCSCNDDGKCASGLCRNKNTNNGYCDTYTVCDANTGRPNGCSCNDGNNSSKCASGYCTKNSEGGTCQTRPVPYVYVPPPRISTSCQTPNTDIMFVMDTSNSMKGGDLGRAANLVTIISLIAAQSEEMRRYNGNVIFRIGLATFDSAHKDSNHPRGVLVPLTTNYQEVINKVWNQVPDRYIGTCLECALDNTKNENDVIGAFKAVQANTRKIVIVLTDANITHFQDDQGEVKGDANDDNMRRRAEESAFQASRRVFNTFNGSLGGAVQFYVINYGETRHDGFLRRMVYDQINNYYGQGEYVIEKNTSNLEVYYNWSHIIRGGFISPGAFERPYRGLAGWPISLTCKVNGVQMGSRNVNANTGGWYDFTNLADADYHITIPAQQGYVPESTDYRDIRISKGNDWELWDWFYSRQRSISGCVYNDVNGNGVKDGLESYNGLLDMSINPYTNINILGNGCFSFNNLTSTSYTIQNESLPAGFSPTFPKTNAYTINFNSTSSCITPTNNGTPTCTNTSATNVNFGFTNATPWIQTSGFDVKDDNGISNNITAPPPGGTNACGGVMIRGTAQYGAGVVYSGVNSATFGAGKASDNNWVVSNIAPEYSGGIKTSYQSMTDFITGNNQAITTVTNECNPNSCTIGNTFTSRPYLVNDNLILGGATITSTQKIVLLVNGDVTINGPITVAPGGFFMLVAKGNVTVASSVGANTGTRTCAGNAINPQTAQSHQIQAIISTDQSIFIQGQGSAGCPTGDLQLNIAGSLIMNAGRDGGELVNSRSLCGGNLQYPTLTIQPRLDFLLNAPSYILRPTTSWQEVAP